MTDLAHATTVGEVPPLQASRADLASSPALFFLDTLYTYADLDAANGLMNNAVLPLRTGASIALAPRFDLAGFWRDVAAYRPTYSTAVPTVLARLMEAWDGRADRSSLRFVRTGAAPMAVALQRQVEERLGVPVIVSHGLTEGTCTCAMNPVGPERPLGSMGPALPRETIAVADGQGRPLEPRGSR